jgi:hypothetical protein
MAGLSDTFKTTSTVATTLPSWYDTAQQNLTAQNLTTSVPAANATAAQGAINNLAPGSPNNAFNSGRDLLTQIGQGAANPWVTTMSPTGQPMTTGNPNTAIGGLFNAQTDYLNQIMPNISANQEIQNIGSGNFGSLRGMTAVNKARGDAMSDLFQKQNTLALQNQQTGVSAGTGLGSLGDLETRAGLNAGTFQLEAPFKGVTQQANILNNLKPGTTVNTVGTPSPLNQLGALGSLGTGLFDGLFGKSVVSNGQLVNVPGLLSRLPSLFGGGGGGSGETPYDDLEDPGGTTPFVPDLGWPDTPYDDLEDPGGIYEYEPE